MSTSLFPVYMSSLYNFVVQDRVSPVPNHTFDTCRFLYTEGFFDGASKVFPSSMAFAYFSQARLPFALEYRLYPSVERYPECAHDAAEFTLCYGLYLCSPCFRRYFILPLSTPYFYGAPGLATRLLGDYRDGTFTR